MTSDNSHNRGVRQAIDRRSSDVGSALLRAIRTLVAERFEGLTGQSVGIVPIDVPMADRGAPEHAGRPPACRDCCMTAECALRWEGHVAMLGRSPATYWHCCIGGKLCGVVPVVANGRFLAACQLICDRDADRKVFQRHLELLEVLVENWIAKHGATLVEVGGQAAPEVPVEKESWHPSVRRAVGYIRQHLAESTLSVASVARVLETNSTYLGHLFASQVGMTMRRYIAKERIALAQRLLITTDWQIKRVARASGHSNPDWFSHVFRAATGLTPRAYRSRAHSAGSGPL